MKLSIKKIKRLAEMEKPKAIARYLANFVPPEKKNALEVKLDEYAHSLVKNVNRLNRADIEKRLGEISSENLKNTLGCMLCGEQLANMEDFLNHIDDKHPDVAEKIKQKWKEDGFIK